MGRMTNASLVLVGNPQGGTISVLRLEEGHLTPVLTTFVGEGCGTFAVDDERRLVYAATTAPRPAVVTLTLDPASGALTETARTDIPDKLAYLSLARQGTLLLGASYHGGWGAVWPIIDGSLGTASGRVEFPHVHCVVADPAGLNAYFVSLGGDLIAQYALDARGELRALVPGTVAAPEGSGPRHLILSADGSQAYVITEFSGEVIRYARGVDGALSARESVEIADPAAALGRSRLGADPAAERLIWGADVHLARGGDLLLATERTASTVASVAVGEGGILGAVVARASTAQQPRGFAVSPRGDLAVIAGEASGGVALVSVGPDGALRTVQTVPTGHGPNWVRFVSA